MSRLKVTLSLVIALAMLLACGRGMPAIIHVRNESGVELRHVALSGTGFNVSLAAIAAGA